jgi:thioredoxin reductase (NADPH)
METNVEGVFAVGDVRDKFLKQVATAVGDGAVAGFAVEKYLAESETFHNQIMKSDMPGLVYIWNAVDPQCRELLPLIEKYEAESQGKTRVTKVDIYKSAGIANRLGIDQAPCVVSIKDGKISKIIKEISEKELSAI